MRIESSKQTRLESELGILRIKFLSLEDVLTMYT